MIERTIRTLEDLRAVLRAFAHDLLDVAAVALDLETVEAGELDRLAAERAERLRALAECLDEREKAETAYQRGRADMLEEVADKAADNIIGAALGRACADDHSARTEEDELAEAFAEADGLRSDLGALRSAAQALVDALPRCDNCMRPATRAWERGKSRWCDQHAPWVPMTTYGRPLYSKTQATEYPRAFALRALVALLGAPETVVEAAKRTWKERASAEAALAARLERAAALDVDELPGAGRPTRP